MMSKKEIYAWCSLATSLVLLGFYLVVVFGWPGALENHSDYITGLFWRILGIAFVVELILDLLKYFNVGGVDKDERDDNIAAKGYRNAYYLLMISLIIVISNLLLSDVIRQSSGEQVMLAFPFATFHVLVAILFTAHITKTATQLYLYHTY